MGDFSVAVAKGEDPKGTVERAMDCLGGMDKFVFSGATVFIKPNWVSVPPPGKRPEEVVTDVRVVSAVVELAKAAGAKRVLVGDGPGTNMKGRRVMTALRMEGPVRKAGGELCYFEEEEFVKVRVPEGNVLRSIKLPKAIVEADLIFNMPKMKTNGMGGGVTLGLKNMFGVPEYFTRLPWHKWPQVFYVMTDLAKVLPSALVVVDGITAMEGNGPITGTLKKMNVIVAGKNVVAVDSVAAYIMGFDPYEIPCYPIAESLGLGPADLKKIDVVGEDIRTVRDPFRRATASYYHPSPNVTVYPGGGCYGCATWISRIPPPSILDPAKKYALVVGQGAILPAAQVNQFSEVWLVGKCAVDGYRNYLKKKGLPSKVVPGCPPYCWFSKNVGIPEREKMTCAWECSGRE